MLRRILNFPQACRKLSSNKAITHPQNIRNIGIIAHIDAGKTTTTERILYYSGHTLTLGNVDDGSTVTDYLPAERERGITIQSACIPLAWNGCRVNLIDTPGHVDFTMEVERCVRVLDGGVLILDAVAGVEAQTETVWNQANHSAIPRIAFVNKMDREGACLSRCVAEMRSRLKGWGSPVVIQWPILSDPASRNVYGKGSGGSAFVGAVDLVHMSHMLFNGASGSNIDRIPLDETNDKLLWKDCVEARRLMIDELCDVDDALLDKLLQVEDIFMIRSGDIKAAIRRATLSGAIIPVLVGASFRNIGVQPLMDAVVDYLPSPLDRPDAKGFVMANGIHQKKSIPIAMKDSNMIALAFKIIHDKNKGPLVFVRVYSGSLDSRAVLLNTTQGCAKERATKVLQMYADDYEEIPRIEAGNIGAIQGLRFTKTGDTLASPRGQSLKRCVQLMPITIPPPVFFCSIEAPSGSEEKKFEDAISALIREDPSLYFTTDPDTKQTLLGGMGELHLEVSIGRLKDVHRVDARVGKVMIGYRETVTLDLTVKESFIYDRELFGRKNWASVSIKVCQVYDIHDLGDIKSSDGDGNVINMDKGLIAQAAGKTIDPVDVQQALFHGIKSALSRGPFLGFPMTNLKVVVTSLECRPDLTTISAIRVAAHRVTLNAIIRAANISANETPIFGRCGTLLEPIMNVDIRIPQRYVGPVTRDLGGVRRGQILSLESDSDDTDESEYTSRVVKARIPLSSMMGYSTSLRGLTQGTGSFGMVLSGFGLVHGDKRTDVVKDIRGYV